MSVPLPEFIKDAYRSYRDSYFKWKYVDNSGDTLRHAFGAPKLNSKESDIVFELENKGVAMSDVWQLGMETEYEDLLGSVEKLEVDIRDEINRKREGGDDGAREKSFLVNYLGERPKCDPGTAYYRCAMHRVIDRIAKGYLKLQPQLNYYNIWRNFAGRETPQRSQFWHRDRDDKRIFKVFIYLCDVDAEGGAFSYAQGSHANHQMDSKIDWFREEGHSARRCTDEVLSRVCPQERWIQVTGKKGSVVFADTTGIHKGGHPKTRDRLIFNCMFTSRLGKSYFSAS